MREIQLLFPEINNIKNERAAREVLTPKILKVLEKSGVVPLTSAEIAVALGFNDIDEFRRGKDYSGWWHVAGVLDSLLRFKMVKDTLEDHKRYYRLNL